MTSWRRVSPDGVAIDAQGFHQYAVTVGDARDGVVLPLVTARAGDGPSVLVVGGTHGDEFEGQIAVANLVRALPAAAVHGALIVLPLHNPLACRAGTRRTPRDGADLNRLYTGTNHDGPTGAIATYVTTKILPHVDLVVDLHSGGDLHEFVLSANLQAIPGSSEYDAMAPLLKAFGAPYSIVFAEAGAGSMPHLGTLEGLARQMGKQAISSELGGGGRATAESLAVAERGLSNILRHVGVVRLREQEAGPASRVLALCRPEHYAPAPVSGRLAPKVTLGQQVEPGAILGLVHSLDDPASEPFVLRAAAGGVVVARFARGLLDAHDIPFYIAEPL